ncbi:hypothetical protein AB0D32_18920 [Micromonospora sp. NPDC048170]|uniref:hypothetical protein n=1 Tax=Micromonospora sp. NPDC048170 TaxID=3154819 RepID=UPI0033F6765B
MIDLDQRIVRTLRERAEGTVDTDRLTALAVARGKARRRRRQAGTGVAVGLAAVLGFTVATGTGLPERVRPPDAAAPAVATAAPARLDGVPGAAARPDLVGTDPQVLHFGFDPARARYLGWQVESGVEGARIAVDGNRAVTVELASSAAALMHGVVDGLPVDVSAMTVEEAYDGSDRRHRGRGETPSWFRLWQPAPGLYARASVTAATAREIDVAVDALRLDDARRCDGPVRLTTLPTGARLTGCRIDADSFPDTLRVSLRVAATEQRQMTVSFEYASSIASSRAEGNRTIAGRPAYRYPQGEQLELLGFPEAHLVADFGWPFGGFTEQDAALVLGGAWVAEDLGRPETWD